MEPLDLTHVLGIKPSLRMERTDDAVFFIGEQERFVLSGRRAAEVVALVDRRRTVGDVLEAASARVPEAEAFYTLHRLAAGGYLVPVEAGDPCEGAAFWHGVGLDARAARDVLGRTPVSLHALGEVVPVEWMAEALQQIGVRIDGDAVLRVVVTDDYLRSDLSAFNRSARCDGGPWCLVKPVGVKPLIGPIFQPGTGPCWECLAFWMRNNRPVEELVLRCRGRGGHISPPRAILEVSARAACGLAALAIARGVVAMSARLDPVLSSQVLALDLASFQTSVHAVVKRPQCPACGNAVLMAAIGERPIALQPIEKAHVEDGGHRRQSPRRTYEDYRHLVSPITGPVTHLVPMPGRDTELRAVYASGYMICPREGVPHTNVFDKGCAGKGRSAEQARVSALCEALERYSGVYQGDEARIRASKDDLGPVALSLCDLLNFSEAQYRGRDRHATSTEPRRWVPEPLDSTTRIDWTPGWSLSRQEKRYVPLTYCYAEAPAECGTAFCRAAGNGVAAGTCLEEAVLQALLELVERDAAAVWWYNRIRRPAIDLDSFGEAYFDALRGDYARLGWNLWVLDLTHDLAIPACVALAHHPQADRFAIGFGCHLEPRLAVQRALTEVNQLFEPTGARRAPWDPDRLLSREYLFPDRDLPPATAQSMSRLGGADLHADVEKCMQRLHDAGLELVVVDKTRPDIGLCVVQAIVPGLRHFWPRFGTGRLYDVPCAMGLLPRALTEAELNPVPLFV